MNTLILLFGIVLGILLGYFCFKTRIENLEFKNDYKNELIKMLEPENQNYYKIKNIINSKGLIVDKYDKIKELVDKDN